MRFFLPIVIILSLSACMTSFRNTIEMTIQRDTTAHYVSEDSVLFAVLQNIADVQHLSFNPSKYIQGKRVSYQGRPYHEYELNISDSSNGAFMNISFIHTAMVSSKNVLRDETEVAMLDSLKNIFQSKIVHENINFKQ